ncbi:MAG: hypothetical protein H0Z39_11335 [Peptococcaceae bacterium]|nr:hypothetical protein [Peptococcaceae bacterium]
MFWNLLLSGAAFFIGFVILDKYVYKKNLGWFVYAAGTAVFMAFTYWLMTR